MSLAASVKVVIEGMEEMAIGREDVTRGVLKAFAKQLRKAVEEEENSPAAPGVVSFGTMLSPDNFHAIQIEKARQERRAELAAKQQEKADREENAEPRMIRAVGGPYDGTMVPSPQTLKVGELQTAPGGAVYRLDADGEMHYMPAEPVDSLVRR